MTKRARIYVMRLGAFQDSCVPRFAREIRKEKNRYIDAQIAYYRRVGMLSDTIEHEHSTEIMKIYKKNVRFIFTGTARIALDALPDLKSRISRETKRMTIENALSRWYAFYSADKIKKIARTTTSDLRRLMSAAFESELPERDVIKQGLLAKGLSAFRAETIARTETGFASSYASSETVRDMANEVGVKLFKTWIAVNDERTRADHSTVDGERVADSEKFFVGGEYLDRPKDPSASASNVINCRCEVAWETDF